MYPRYRLTCLPFVCHFSLWHTHTRTHDLGPETGSLRCSMGRFSTVKLCICHGLCASFNFGVQLQFKCSFYSREAMCNVCKTRTEKQSGTCKVKASTTMLVNKHWNEGSIWHEKRSSVDIWPPVSSRGIYSSAAYVHLEFGQSHASIWVRLIIKCGFYARLYGNCFSRFLL